MSRGGGAVRSVSRALSVLALFDADHPVWSLGELTRATGLPKSTVVRILATLEAEGMLWLRPDGRVAPGAGLLRWVGLARSAWELSDAATQVLADLAAGCGESAAVYVRQGLSRVLVARVDGPGSLRHVLPVGHTMPLTAGAASWVLLATSPQDVVSAVAELDDAPPDLRDRVRAAARQGWSRSDGERERGVSGVAVPVGHEVAGPADGAGRLALALAVGGPTSRFDTESIAGFVAQLTCSAEQLRGGVFVPTG